MLLNIVFALILSRYYAHVGLAAASSFAALANMSLLLYFLRREGVSLKTGSLWFFLRVLSPTPLSLPYCSTCKATPPTGSPKPPSCACATCYSWSAWAA